MKNKGFCHLIRMCAAYLYPVTTSCNISPILLCKFTVMEGRKFCTFHTNAILTSLTYVKCTSDRNKYRWVSGLTHMPWIELYVRRRCDIFYYLLRKSFGVYKSWLLCNIKEKIHISMFMGFWFRWINVCACIYFS